MNPEDLDFEEQERIAEVDREMQNENKTDERERSQVKQLVKKQNGGWISIRDKLPERQENVKYSQVLCLVVFDPCPFPLPDGKDSYVRILAFNHLHNCWDDEDLDDYCCDISDVSHWMLLPNKPKT